MEHSPAKPGNLEIETGMERQPLRRPRIQLINVPYDDTAANPGLMPLAACDCDNHNPCTVHCVVGDVEIEACGVWG